MAKQKKKNSTFKDICLWLLLVLLLVLVLSFVVRLSDCSLLYSFYVEYDGNVYKTDTENVLDLPESGQARFDVKNCDSCTVKVLPNVSEETDFTFTADGTEHKYSDIEDMTSAFIQTNNVYGDYFIIDCDNDYSLESVLQRLYGADSVEINNVAIAYPYKIVVTSSDGEIIEIYILIGNLVTGITLTPDHIIFY